MTWIPRHLRPRFAGGLEGWPSGQWQQTVNLPTNVYVGSNPTPSTIAGRIKTLSGYSTTVVQQPSKLRMPVRFRLPAPTHIQPPRK